MIAAQAVRVALPRGRSHAPRARTIHARARSAGRVSPRREARGRSSRSPAASWDLRVFSATIAAIVLAFALALAYVGDTTALSLSSYTVQKLESARDELRRQNALLEVQSARLDAPARIAADAARLGMVHASYVPVISARPLTAKR